MDGSIKMINTDIFELKSQKVYRIIKTAIIKGIYGPGEKLSDYKIAKEMNVSKTPVRESLYRLISEGFIKNIPNQGIIVSDVSKKDLKDVYELRILLEGYVSYNLAKKIKKNQIEELKNIVNSMQECISQKNINYEYFSILDDKFHFYLITLIDNYQLEKVYENLASIAFRFRLDSLKKGNRIKKSFREVLNILESIEKRDCEMSRKNAILHIKNGLKNILKVTS